jgi:hypothetical protein
MAFSSAISIEKYATNRFVEFPCVVILRNFLRQLRISASAEEKFHRMKPLIVLDCHRSSKYARSFLATLFPRLQQALDPHFPRNHCDKALGDTDGIHLLNLAGVSSALLATTANK